MLWKTPIYPFEVVIDGKKEKLLIDVTGSAPNFKEPGKQLEGTFKVLLKDLEPSETKILDFGAAKLRNTIYLLKQGYQVYSCEFNDLFRRSKQANDFLKEAMKYPNFRKLVFPDEFIDFDGKFDVILLINVLNIMPVPLERYCVLALCREKISKNGRLLWYTQHGTYSEKDAVTLLFDGLVTGKGRNFHMFYRDFTRKEIHDMLRATGFSYNNDFKFPTSGNNQAYVFSPDGIVLVNQAIDLLRKGRKLPLKKIERKSRWDTKKTKGGGKSETVTYETKLPTKIPEVRQISLLEEYSTQLSRVKPGGGKKASRYHQIIFNILSDIFYPQLKNPKKEEKINQGRKRIDITFDNKAEEGFFKELRDRYKIHCPIIFIECKNYTKALETPEYDQIDGRLNKRRGMFGIIVCRNIEDQDDVLQHCRDLVRENPGAEKYVIVLVDEDIKYMIKRKLDNDSESIDDLLHKKLRELIM